MGFPFKRFAVAAAAPAIPNVDCDDEMTIIMAVE